MKVPSIINKFGKVAGWNDISSSVLGRTPEGITEISYSDEVDVDNVYGAGGFPIGYSEGNYKATASITLSHEEVIALQRSIPPGKRLQDIAPFDITIQYEYENLIHTNILCNCRIKNNGVEVKQGDKTIGRKLDLLLSHIEWNA